MNIYQRMLAVADACGSVAKTKGGGERFATVKHDDVTAALRPLFIKHGVMVNSSVASVTVSEPWESKNRIYRQTDIMLDIAFVNVDDPTDRIDVKSCGAGIDYQDKGVGKAFSYAWKYAVMKNTMLETGDDADNDTRQPSAPDRRQSNRTPAKPAPQPDGGPSYITEAQRKRLWTIYKNNPHAMSETELRAIVKREASVTSSREIEASLYEAVCNAVESWTPDREATTDPNGSDDLSP